MTVPFEDSLMPPRRNSIQRSDVAGDQNSNFEDGAEQGDQDQRELYGTRSSSKRQYEPSLSSLLNVEDTKRVRSDPYQPSSADYESRINTRHKNTSFKGFFESSGTRSSARKAQISSATTKQVIVEDDDEEDEQDTPQNNGDDNDDAAQNMSHQNDVKPVRVLPPRSSRYRDSLNENYLDQVVYGGSKSSKRDSSYRKSRHQDEFSYEEEERQKRDTAKSRQQRYLARYGDGVQDQGENSNFTEASHQDGEDIDQLEGVSGGRKTSRQSVEEDVDADSNKGYRLRKRFVKDDSEEVLPSGGYQDGRRLTRNSNRMRSESPDARGYRLRPRQERIDYKVRIPLYDASPRKDQLRRKAMASSSHRRDFNMDQLLKTGFRSFGSLFKQAKGNVGPADSDDDDGDFGSPAGKVNDIQRIGQLRSSGIQPLNMTSLTSGSYDNDRLLLNKTGKVKLSDSDPVAVDSNVTFDSVGGLDGHIKSLKEMVLLPLMYPEVFEKFSLVPPRGVIFHGPPGTGKTLLARALANACSFGDQKVAFFMRKGADVLSKWVGDSERQLKELFEQARQMSPAIIFFDEIDGLAPVRSAKQDQIHSSIVTTLLALMDGLDSRGNIVVIGATNRIDAIDPALRRTGRFDREFLFSLPDMGARKKIIQINSQAWNPPLHDQMLEELAEVTRGYGGSDLRGLCTEAALCALERCYPGIYTSDKKLAISVNDVQVERSDFIKALSKIAPSTQRTKSKVAKPLTSSMNALLADRVEQLYQIMVDSMPCLDASNAAIFTMQDQIMQTVPAFANKLIVDSLYSGNGQVEVALAAMNKLENVVINQLDFEVIHNEQHQSAEAALSSFFRECKRQKSSVIFLPNLGQFYSGLGESCRRLFLDLVETLPQNCGVFILATSSGLSNNISGTQGSAEDDDDDDFLELKAAFGVENDIIGSGDYSASSIFILGEITQSQRLEYFKSLAQEVTQSFGGIQWDINEGTLTVDPLILDPSLKQQEQQQQIPIAPIQPAEQQQHRDLTVDELQMLYEHDESVFRKLRMLLREFCSEIIRCKEYKAVVKNLNPLEDYGDVVKMDAQDILEKVERHGYQTIKPFKEDIAEMVEGFRRFAYERDEVYRLSSVNALSDLLEEWIRTFDPQFLQQANESAARQKRLGPEYEKLIAKVNEQRMEYYKSLKSKKADREEAVRREVFVQCDDQDKAGDNEVQISAVNVQLSSQQSSSQDSGAMYQDVNEDILQVKSKSIVSGHSNDGPKVVTRKLVIMDSTDDEQSPNFVNNSGSNSEQSSSSRQSPVGNEQSQLSTVMEEPTQHSTKDQSTSVFHGEDSNYMNVESGEKEQSQIETIVWKPFVIPYRAPTKEQLTEVLEQFVHISAGFNVVKLEKLRNQILQKTFKWKQDVMRRVKDLVKEVKDGHLLLQEIEENRDVTEHIFANTPSLLDALKIPQQKRH
ncbi:hypothetical protein MP228_000153 [Amoeboaphelidium protococcarum]|nr:hypothetical protein MP228_000153 [Amoeboaphelidium protococcarum]